MRVEPARASLVRMIQRLAPTLLLLLLLPLASSAAGFPAETTDLPPLPPAGEAVALPTGTADPDPVATGALLERMDSAAGRSDWQDAARAAWQLMVSGGGSERLRWIDAEGGTVWSAAIDAGAGNLGRMADALHRAGRDDLAEAVLRRALELGEPAEEDWAREAVGRLEAQTEPIRARTWDRLLEPLTLDIIDGEPVRTGDLLGDVLVLDFWASWCEPCREELPLMQAFHKENQHRGLHTFAVNVDEPRSVAKASARMLGIELPVAVYTPEMRLALDVVQVPTVILIDRAGRIRGRWEVFKGGTEDQIFWAIGEILDLKEAEPETIARQVAGEHAFSVRWMREFRAPLEGIEVIAPPDGSTRVVLTHSRTLLKLKPDGETEAKLSGVVAGRVVASEPDADGGYAVLSYRMGATGVSRVDFPAGTHTALEAPAPVFDARWADPREPQAGTVFGTLNGVALADREGAIAASAEIGLVRGLAPYPAGPAGNPSPVWLALTGRAEPRELTTLGADLSVLDKQVAGTHPWRLEKGTEGRFGLLPDSVRALATGRFFSGVEQDQVAVAGRGQLVVLLAETGRELFRARWEDVGHLAAGDLDGDGLDELIVAWGPKMAVLSSIDAEKRQKM